MLNRLSVLLLLMYFPHGCLSSAADAPVQLNYRATGNTPQVLAVYEAWFGHPRHISVGYSSQDPEVIDRQIKSAKAKGITGFVVDWYGDREPFINRAYAEMQKAAGNNRFQVAMMYDETNHEEDATDVAIADGAGGRGAGRAARAGGREAGRAERGH